MNQQTPGTTVVARGSRTRLPRFVERCIALTLTAGCGLACSSSANAGPWTIRLDPMYAVVRGQDQHVLTIHQTEAGTLSDLKTAVHLETDSDFAIRGGLDYTAGSWTWGFYLEWIASSQSVPDQTATGTTAKPVGFEIADRTYTSTGASQSLYYRVLEDTDLVAWKLELHALRLLAETPHTRLKLKVGATFGDFDNDYRAVVGVENVGGTRLDASSNYSWMAGPLVGLVGEVQWGHSTLAASFEQSVILGEPELSTMAREFSGAFGETVTFTSEESFTARRDIAIPITSFGLRWTRNVSAHLAIGLGASASVWWDVSVPPGVIPVPGGDQALHENTIAYHGLFAAVEYAF